MYNHRDKGSNTANVASDSYAEIKRKWGNWKTKEDFVANDKVLTR
jgi:hypothetical protein